MYKLITSVKKGKGFDSRGGRGLVKGCVGHDRRKSQEKSKVNELPVNQSTRRPGCGRGREIYFGGNRSDQCPANQQ